MANTCDHGNEPLGYKKDGELPVKMNDYQLLRKDNY